jgi:phosphonatase-like hydrolase
MIKMVVFDMAGTTVDEDNVVYKTIQRSLNDAGYPASLEDVLIHCAGKEKLRAIKDILETKFGVADDQIANRIHTAFRVMLTVAYDELDVKPIRGADDIFAYLKDAGLYCVLNTGYDHDTAHKLLRKLGWEESNAIDAVVTASDVSSNRPEPDMILLGMKKMGITNPLEVIKVGDSAIDIEEGQNAGCGLNIGITTGAQTREQLLQQRPDHVIDDLRELIDIIRKNNIVPQQY